MVKSDWVVIPMDNNSKMFSSKFLARIKKEMENKRKKWVSQNKRIQNRSPLITVRDLSTNKNELEESNPKPLLKIKKDNAYIKLKASPSKHFVDNVQYMRKLSISSKQSKVRKESEWDEKSVVSQHPVRINSDDKGNFFNSMINEAFKLIWRQLLYSTLFSLPLSSPLWIWKNLGLWNFCLTKNLWKNYSFELTVN